MDSKTYGPGHTDAKFSGSAASLSGKFPGTKGYPAAYPAEGAKATLPENNQFIVGSCLPNKQSFKNGSFEDNVYPMAAVSRDGIEYQFQNICGLIQINIRAASSSTKTEKIKAVYLYGNNGETVAGTVGMWFDAATCAPVGSTEDKDNGIKVGTFGNEAYEKLILDFGSSPLELSKTDLTTINFALIPQDFEDGITVEIVDKNMGSTFYYTEPLTIKRSMIKEITPIIDYTAPDPLEIANSYIYEEPGTYLMPAFAMGNRLDVKIDVAKHPNLNADLLWTDIVVPGTGGGATPATKIDAVTDIQYIKMDDGNNLMQFKINTDPDNKSWLNNSGVATKGKNQPQTGGDTHGSTGLADAGHEAYWNRTKTIMDPCPVGYTVLGERSGKLINNDTKTFIPSSLTADVNDGIGLFTTFSYGGSTYTVWWPAAGVRARDGRIADVGHYGAYFYYDHISATHGGHGMLFNVSAITNKGTVTGVRGGWDVEATKGGGGVITGHSTPIRCVRAKQFTDLTKYPLK